MIYYSSRLHGPHVFIKNLDFRTSVAALVLLFLKSSSETNL